MGEQTIYRVASRDIPFVQVANAMLRDTKLSIEARGALALILTYPANWEVKPEWLAEMCCIGRDKARGILKEMVKHKYCTRKQSRENGATFGGSVYWFTDLAGALPNVSQDEASPQPEKPSTEPPQADLPLTESPAPENPPHKNKEEGKNTVVVEDTPLPPKKGAGPTPTDAMRAFEAYNAVALRCALPQASVLTKDRQRRIIARLKDYGLDGWARALANIEKSSFLRGQTDAAFRADLDFVCQAKSFGRLHDGGYGNGAHSPTPPKSRAQELIDKMSGKPAQEAAPQ